MPSTMIGCVMLGRISRAMTKAERSPRRRAAITYSRSRSPMTAARTVRLTTGVNNTPMVRMMIAVPLPNSDRMRMAVMMIGSASSTSMPRIMMSSVRPR